MRESSMNEEVDPDELEEALRTLTRWIANEHRRRFARKDPAAADRVAGRTSAPVSALGDEQRLLDVDALARYLSIPKATIYTWVCMRKIPEKAVVRLGRTLKFDRGEIDSWVDRSRPEPQKTRMG